MSLLVAAGFWLVSFLTGEHMKPELTTLLEARTGLTVDIGGDLRWHFLWPTAVTIERVQAVEAREDALVQERWNLDLLRLELDTASVLRAPASPLAWTVIAFQVEGLRGRRDTPATESTERFAVPSFWIRQLRPDRPAPFAAELRYQSGELEPVAIDLAGRLRFDPTQRALAFAPLKIDGNLASGDCQARFALVNTPERTAALRNAATRANEPPPGAGLIDLARFRTTDWQASCRFDQLQLGAESFADATLATANTAGAADLTIAMPAFFGGTAKLALRIDASAARNQPMWFIEPRITDAASERLIRWLSTTEPSPPGWSGPINLSGQLDARGNTHQSIIKSGVGELRLVSTSGTLKLTGIKQQANEPLERIGSVIGESDLLGSWPDTLAYDRMLGLWQVNQGEQQFEGTLDNFELAGAGTLTPGPRLGEDRLDLRGTLKFSGSAQRKSLPVNGLMEDVPLPFRCQGVSREPVCTMDSEQAKTLLADALSGKGRAQLAGKIDRIIDEKVPEQYRRAARGLLEIFSQSIEDDGETSDREFMEGSGDEF
ncbi:MAG: hypothetical protein AAF648_14795 [Pseudomonadota bacterium]